MTDNDQKVCPLARGLPDSESSLCIREKCACHVSLVKPVDLTKDIIDPEDCYRDEGCGLIQAVPWKLLKRPEKGVVQ
jgi:hypothetical protein